MTGRSNLSIDSSGARWTTQTTTSNDSPNRQGVSTNARFVRTESTADAGQNIDLSKALREAPERVLSLVGQSSQVQSTGLLRLLDSLRAIPAARSAVGMLLEGGSLHVPGALEQLANYLGELDRPNVATTTRASSGVSTDAAVTSAREPHLGYKKSIEAYFLSTCDATMSGAEALASRLGSIDPYAVVQRVVRGSNFGATPEFKKALLPIVAIYASNLGTPKLCLNRDLKSDLDRIARDAPYNIEAVRALVNAAGRCMNESRRNPDVLTYRDIMKNVDPLSVSGVRVLLERPKGYVLSVEQPYPEPEMTAFQGNVPSSSDRPQSTQSVEGLEKKRPRPTSEHRAQGFGDDPLSAKRQRTEETAAGVTSWPGPDSEDFNSQALYDTHVKENGLVQETEERDARFDFLADRLPLETFPFSETASGSPPLSAANDGPRVLPFGVWKGWSLDSGPQPHTSGSNVPIPVNLPDPTGNLDGTKSNPCVPVHLDVDGTNAASNQLVGLNTLDTRAIASP